MSRKDKEPKNIDEMPPGRKVRKIQGLTIVEHYGYASEVMQLSVLGLNAAQIAAELNRLPAPVLLPGAASAQKVKSSVSVPSSGVPAPPARARHTFTEEEIAYHLEYMHKGGVPDVTQLYKAKSRIALMAQARQQMDLFSQLQEKGLRSKNWGLVRTASENLLRWWEQTAKGEKLFAPETQVNILQQFNNIQIEAAALAQAVEEACQDNPELWQRILKAATDKVPDLAAKMKRGEAIDVLGRTKD